MRRRNPVRDPEHRQLLKRLSRHFSIDEAALRRLTKNPGRRKHTSKWDHCVEQVRRSGRVSSAEAVCTASLGRGAYVKGRASNPLPRSGKYELTLIWTDPRGKEHTVFQRFATRADAGQAGRRVTIRLDRQGMKRVRYNVRERVPFNP